MIQHRFYPTDPWAVRETELDLSVLAQSESIFALSNGHIGLRANLEEGEPHGLLRGCRADAGQRHQRQDHPPACGRRAI